MPNVPTKKQLNAAVKEIDDLCRREYEYGLVELLKEPDERLKLERLRRLTGIVIKRPFAEPTPIEPKRTETGSRFAWIWQFERLDDRKLASGPEYTLLSQIAGDQLDSGSIHELHERGLYKFLALWLEDKLRGRETKRFREYLDEPEEAEFETLLNIADWVSQTAIAATLGPLVGIDAVVVTLGLIGGSYGWRKLTESSDKRLD